MFYCIKVYCYIVSEKVFFHKNPGKIFAKTLKWYYIHPEMILPCLRAEQKEF